MMKSAIMAVLAAATKLSMKDGEDITKYQGRLIAAVGDLPDDAWNALGRPAQDWYNEAADALNDGKDIPAFPDAEDDAPPERTSRRRTAAPEPTAAEPKVGDAVEILTKRGKTVSGTITEIDDEVVVLDGDNEVDRSRIETIAVTGASAEAGGDDEPAIAEPKVGDSIVAVTKRGKTKEGKVVEVEDGLVVIKDAAGEEEELDVDKLESLKIVEAVATETKPSRRGASAPAPTEKESTKTEGKAPRATAKANGGISATGRMRELIVDDLDATEEQINKLMKKEGLQFKDNTLALVYADAHRIIKLLRDTKQLK